MTRPRVLTMLMRYAPQSNKSTHFRSCENLQHATHCHLVRRHCSAPRSIVLSFLIDLERSLSRESVAVPLIVRLIILK
ncbi:unnamed protein product [Amoebophrya sp. A25]|nr:unnamed protein product [Amoebophrya sp. A25]|eukprot:GSA25T00005376001.1